MTYLGWLKACFLSSGEQYASFGTLQAYSVEQFLKKNFFCQTEKFSTFLPFGRISYMWELQYVLFFAQQVNTLLLVPHMPTLKQSFKMSNFRKIKKGRGRFCISTNLGWFKVCFLSSGGQYASFSTLQA